MAAAPAPTTKDGKPMPPVPKFTDFVNPFVIVASSSAAVSARCICHPLDTYRIRVQTYTGPKIPSFKELVPAPRLRTLYSGLPVALAFSIPALSIYLTTYEASKRYFASVLFPPDVKPGMFQQLPVFVLSGLTSELASGAIWTPMDVLKARLQKGGEGTSATKLLRKIWKEEGHRGVWRGYWLSNLVFVPYISLFWLSYESLKTHFIPGYEPYGAPTPSPRDTTDRAPQPLPPPPPEPAPWSVPVTLRYTLCSVTAVVVSACVTSPIDLIQARWQTSGGAGIAKDGIRGIARDIWRQGGIRGFGRGLGIRLAYAIPSNGISMTTYETIKRWNGI